MYKLTYNTDDDLDNDLGAGNNMSRKHEKETATFERSDNLYSKPLAYQSSEKRYTNMVERDGKNDNSNVTDSIYGRKIVKDTTKKKNRHLISQSPKKLSMRSRCYKDCSAILLVVYLLLLTASVLALFVLIQQLKQENHVLKLRISSWSSGSPRRREGGLPRTKFQRKFGRGPSSITSTNLDINQCCVSSRKTFREFRAKFAKTSDLVGSLLKAYHEKFEFTTRHFAEIKKDLKILRNRIVKVKSTNEKDDKTEKQLSSKDENQTYCENVAFRFTRADDGLLSDNFDTIPPVYIISQFNENGQTLQYNDEEILGKSQNVDFVSAGTFAAPSEGIYVLFISFCTYDMVHVELGLMRNNKTLRSFRIPILSNDFDDSLKTLQTPYTPETSGQGSFQSSKNIVEHKYSVITQLHKNDEVKLELLSGVIVEMTAQNGKKSQFCTEFSGFKVSS